MSLFEAQKLGEMAPATQAGRLCLLGLWTLVVLFPLYWVAITSFKLPIDVSNGPVYLPFIDFQPSLARLAVPVRRHRPRHVAALSQLADRRHRARRCCAMAFGSMAAYALSRLAYRPRLRRHRRLRRRAWRSPWSRSPASASTGGWRSPWRWRCSSLLRAPSPGALAARSAIDDILFWMVSQRILPPVVAAIPIYVMFQQLGLLDTHVALIITYTTVNLPIVVWLMHDFFVGIPMELEESRPARRRLALRIFFEIVLPLARPGPRRDHAPGADPRLERIPAGAVPLHRQRADHAAARRRAERHARPAMVVHVGADHRHDPAGGRC